MIYKSIVLLLTLVAMNVFSEMSVFAEPLTTVHIKPKATDNFSKASFSLRIPEKVEAPRYILVLLPGFNGDGARLLRNKRWFKFVEETSGAMLACTFRMDKKTPIHYAAAQHGSGSALETAIEQLDAKDTLRSLKELPLLIYGFSAGGQFAYGFSCHNPQRLIGFAAAKGGYYFSEPLDETYKVPGLMISGRKDSGRRKKAIRDLFESHRAKGAPWCWMEDKNGHTAAKCLSVVIPYFGELLRLQLDGQQKKLIDRSKLVGVTVDLVNKNITSRSKTFGANDTNLKQGWLPSESIFTLWSRLDIGMQKYAEQSSSAKK